MKVAFCSNFLNSHQIPFCNKMYELLGDDFHFIATEPMSEERIKLGFNIEPETKYPYLVPTYKGEEEFDRALKYSKEADVVMIGSAPEIFVTERIKQNKLTFRACERYFKRGKWVMLHPKMFISKWKKDIRFRNKNLYMLCASAYTASDCRFIGCYVGKTYKWGYFPIIEKYDFDDLLKFKQNERVKLIWVARFLGLKHPEKPVKILKRLIDNGYDVELDMIGNGPKFEKTKALVRKLSLEEKVNFFGAIPANEVLENMKKSNIFLFTSDRHEGWGAVLNESMSCGCAVVSSDAIGSTPFLIKDGENGFSYKDKNFDDLYNKVETLVKDKELCKKFGRNAIDTVNGLWSAENAADRLVKLFESLLNKNSIEFEDGPCSRAE